MLCIAAFIVFALLGIFSATHRKLAGKAWYCTWRKMTFRPCDISFNEDLRAMLFGKLMFSKPRLAKFLDRTADWFALAFVLISLWSLFSVMLAGINLWVYDTCDPHAVESCSLGGEACTVGSGQLTLGDAVATGDILGWMGGHVTTFGETLSRVPDRFRTWNPADYILPENSYYAPYDSQKSTVLEIIDPGCTYCAQQYEAFKEHNIHMTHNLTYLPYPIQNPDGTYKFKHSPMMAQYLAVLRNFPASTAEGFQTTADWLLLEKLFIGKTPEGASLQDAINVIYTEEQVVALIHEFLEDELGFTEVMIQDLEIMRTSHETDSLVGAMRTIVENEIKVKKIPTFFYEGRRYDRLVTDF